MSGNESSSLRIDELVSTDAERTALLALRAAAGAAESAMERHCLRVFLIMERLAAESSIPLDREVTLCASVFFEIGAYPIASRGGVYTTDGRRFAEELLRPFHWPAERLRICLDAIELHHQLRSQWERGAEVELLRRADLVDALPALIRFGLSRAWLRELFFQVPRRGLYREILRLVTGFLRERPRTIPRILLPPRT